jgi:dTDP-4-dehydrorhamnose 3,5-epimerase
LGRRNRGTAFSFGVTRTDFSDSLSSHSMAINLESTSIKGLSVVNRTAFSDERGSFFRLFCANEIPLAEGRSIVQVNHSRTRGMGTVRGMHFQRPPHAETKIVTCVEGEIFDVAVDLRTGSSTFLQWHAERLNGKSHKSLLIPPGMAHGFQVLSGEATIVYLHDQNYFPESEGRLNPLDPALHIDWPEAVKNLSSSDNQAAFLPAGFSGLNLFS